MDDFERSKILTGYSSEK